MMDQILIERAKKNYAAKARIIGGLCRAGTHNYSEPDTHQVGNFFRHASTCRKCGMVRHEFSPVEKRSRRTAPNRYYVRDASDTYECDAAGILLPEEGERRAEKAAKNLVVNVVSDASGVGSRVVVTDGMGVEHREFFRGGEGLSHHGCNDGRYSANLEADEVRSRIARLA